MEPTPVASSAGFAPAKGKQRSPILALSDQVRGHFTCICRLDADNKEGVLVELECKYCSQVFPANGQGSILKEHYDKHFPIANQGWPSSDMVLDDEWVLDLGVSFHLTSRWDMLQDRRLRMRPISLQFPNGEVRQITEVGLVQSDRFSLPNVHYVPGIRTNRVSANQLSEHGLSIELTREACRIIDPATGRLEVGRGRVKEGQFYVLDYLHVPQAKGWEELDLQDCEVVGPSDQAEGNLSPDVGMQARPSVEKEAHGMLIEWPRRVISGILGWITSATTGHDAMATAPTSSSTGIQSRLMDVDRLTRPTTARGNVTATFSASSIERDGREWVLDAFAFKHHTSNPRLLQLQDQETAAAELDTREGGILRTLGTGYVQTELFNVPGVRYVEGDERNVISVGQLAVDHGLVTVFEPPSCYVKDKKTGKIIGKGRLRSGTYVMNYLRIGQDNTGDGEQLAEGGEEGSGGSGGPTQGDKGGQGGNQDKGEGDERGGAGDGDDQVRERGDDQRGGGDDNSGNQHKGQSGGGGDERGGSGGRDGEGGGEGGGGDNGGRETGGSGGRDGEAGGMEGDEDKDDEEGEEDDEEDAEVKDSSQAGTYLYGLSQLGKYIAAALSYAFFSLLGEGGGGAGEKEKNKLGGTERESKKEGGEEQEPEESSEVHAAMFGLLRPDAFQPSFPHGIYPTSVNEERSDEYLLDTGASFHVTWNEGDLLEYREDLYCHTRPPIWTLGGIYKSEGAGSVDVTRSGYLDGDIKVDGILLAPNVQMNLISFGQLHCQYGVKLEMDTSFVLTRLDGVEVGRGYMKPENHHYVLQYFQPGRLFANEDTFNRNIFGKDFFYPQNLPASPKDTNLQQNEDLPSPDYMIIG